MGRIVEPVPNCLLFDCSDKPTMAQILALRAIGFRGAIRYVGLHGPAPEDIDAAEVDFYMNAGMGLLLVQHPLNPGWVPTESLGQQQGQVAAALARAAGYLPGATLYNDLEGITSGLAVAQIAAFANAKRVVVGQGGFPQGEYIGFNSWLDSDELFHLLDSDTYWKSLSQVPDVAQRSYAIEQFGGWNVRAIGLPIDVNGASADKLGGRPFWMRAA